MISAISPGQGLAAQPLESGSHAKAPETSPAATELVPVAPVQSMSRSQSPRLRPDPSFVMHLIATAALAPQTRKLRQTTASDGMARYAATRVAVQPRASGGSRFNDIA